VRYFLGALPVPDSCTVCEPLPALSKIVSTPVCVMVSGGLKVTDILQLLPGLRSLSLHDFLIANTFDDTVSDVMSRIAPVFLLPPFLNLSDFGLLVFPTVVVPGKSSVVVLIKMFGVDVGVGVGVGVGVRVGVIVAVLVAVTVAVGVGPPVAVEVAVRVGVAVMVAVAVAVGVAVAAVVGVAVAVGVAASGLSYHSTRLLSVSLIARSPRPSAATPCGEHSVAASGALPSKLHLDPLRSSAWPKTRTGVVLLVAGALYSSTRLLPQSTMYRLPDGSTVTPRGSPRPVVPPPPPFAVKLLWPNTVLAVVLFAGFAVSLNSSTRLFCSWWHPVFEHTIVGAVGDEQIARGRGRNSVGEAQRTCGRWREARVGGGTGLAEDHIGCQIRRRIALVEHERAIVAGVADIKVVGEVHGDLGRET
jgi:hypothetical protein